MTSPVVTASAMLITESKIVVTAPRSSNGKYFGHSRKVEIDFRWTTVSAW